MLQQSQSLDRGVMVLVVIHDFTVVAGKCDVYMPSGHGSRLQALVSIAKDVAVATHCIMKHFIC
jgi:hypothetical protein